MIEDLKRLEHSISIKDLEKKKFRKEHIEAFYNSLNKKNEKKILEIYDCLKNDNKKIKKLLKITENIIKIEDFSKYEKAKNNEDLIIFLVSFIILRSFLELSLNSKEDTLHRLNEYELSNHMAENLNNFIVWNEYNSLKKNKNFNIDDLRDLFKNCLINLYEDGVIKMERIRLGRSIKTNRCYEIDVYFTVYESINLLSKDSYNIYNRQEKEIYAMGYHFSLTFKILKENFKSNAIFEINYESKIMENLCNNWVYIDKTFLKEKIEILLKFNKINEDTVVKDFNEYKKQLRESIKLKNINLSKMIAQKLSSYQYAIKLINLLKSPIEENQKIFLSFKFDFRGRIYFLSNISPTHDKIMRYCLHWGKYEEIKPKDHYLNEIIENELKKHIHIIDQWEDFNFSDKKKEIKIAIIWILISAAEINKSKLGSEVKIEKFINEGINVIKNIEKIKNIDDLLKITYLKKILNEINNNIYIKRLISKDATASCYQHLIKCLGNKSEDSLKWCNLSSTDTWYDTYMFLIDSFKKQINSLKYLKKEEFDALFNRKFLKKTIMTLNYGASERTCWDYFNQENNIDSISIEKKNEIRKIFKDFYKFLIKDDSLLKNSTHEIINYFDIEENRFMRMNDSTRANLNYYKTIIKQKEETIRDRRYTSQYTIITDKYDDRKRRLSARANYIQSIDGCLVRWYLSNEKGITIHDCFMIDYMNATYLVAKINEGMQLTFHDLKIDTVNTSKLFSIFIIL